MKTVGNLSAAGIPMALRDAVRDGFSPRRPECLHPGSVRAPWTVVPCFESILAWRDLGV